MFLDSLIHQSLHNDYDTLYKARVLKGILFVFIAILSVVNLWLLTSENISDNGKPLALAICLSMQIMYCICLLMVRLKGAYYPSAHLTLIMTALGVVGGTFLSGGALYAPATSMNILPIIMAFVLVNKQAGVIWTLLILCIHISFVLLQNNGVQFPQMLDPMAYPIQHLSHWLVIYSSLIGLMFVHNTLNTRLKRERDSERKKFQHLASHDPLTNLANRLQFDSNLVQAMNRSDRNGSLTALFFIDLDGFKPVNDTFGHEAGDLVLKEISQRLKHNLRQMDTVARLGGDEFAVILEDITSEYSLQDIAGKLLNVLEEPITFLPDNPVISGSLGISLYPLHTHNKMELMKFADTAMYEAKKNNKRWQMYTPVESKVAAKSVTASAIEPAEPAI